MERNNLLQKAKHLLRLYSFLPKKRLGQNFSVNNEILQLLVSYGSLTKDDTVLEVGPGFGFLTQLLSSNCKKIVAVEVDPVIVSFLRTQLPHMQNVDLIEGDILKVDLPPFDKVVSAPPYSISSPLIFRLLEKNFDFAVLVLQKEFAARMAALVGTKDYSRLTVNLYYRADVELLDTVPRTMFYPPPDVDSMIVRLKPRAPPFHVDDEAVFFEVVQTLFTQRNKKVRNALVPFLRKREMDRKEALNFADSIVYSTKRVRELSPEDFGVLANELIKRL
ncbi:MAG: 16S rRNA (adenine(1518)-N(6)/adenine(1519)-N(6))-dimethyltransferase RsmA [Candidatus Bathyarchaeia archaeon]